MFIFSFLYLFWNKEKQKSLFQSSSTVILFYFKANRLKQVISNLILKYKIAFSMSFAFSI